MSNEDLLILLREKFDKIANKVRNGNHDLIDEIREIQYIFSFDFAISLKNKSEALSRVEYVFSKASYVLSEIDEIRQHQQKIYNEMSEIKFLLKGD